MPRKKPAPRIVEQRSRDNPHRRLASAIPSQEIRADLAERAGYGAYSKHKFNPTAYGLRPYAGRDVERTYCDAHAKFGQADFDRIPLLQKRGIMLGLTSEQAEGGDPSLLWTIDDNGWIYELRMTNSGQAQYHGYPLLKGDAFARQVLARARAVAFAKGGYPLNDDPNAQAAIATAETAYR